MGEAQPTDSTSKKFCAGFSQLFLCGTSGWAIQHTAWDVNPIAFGTFTFLLGHGLLGLIKFSTKSFPETARTVYDYSTFLTHILPLPLINAQVYHNYKHDDIILYLHVASSLLPAVANVTKIKDDYKHHIISLVLIANVGSLGYISVINENYWGIGLSLFCLLNHFAIAFVKKHYSVPACDIWSTVLGFFNIFAVNTLENI